MSRGFSRKICQKGVALTVQRVQVGFQVFFGVAGALAPFFDSEKRKDRLCDVVLELLANWGALHDCQLASHSYSQRDGCRRVHTCHGPDYRDHSAPTIILGGHAFVAAARDALEVIH
jgi:hypothetical protein